MSDWRVVDGKKYYFDPVTKKARTGKSEVDGDIYLFDHEGVLQSYTFYDENGSSYYFGWDGKLVKGLKTISGKKYYFNLETGAAGNRINKSG